MIAHVMISEKFMPPFIALMENEFSQYDHQYFFITSEKYQFGLSPASNINFFHTENDFEILRKELEKADKIILHGLWREKVNLLLLSNPHLLRKSYWVMWGGDFYFPERHSKAQHEVIKKVGYLVTGTKGEIDLVRKWYAAEGKHITSYVYTSNIVEYSPPFTRSFDSNSKMCILLGNSAADTNDHFFIFDQLQPYRNGIASVIVPLSYAGVSNKEYVIRVLANGEKIFGETFLPLTQFLPLDKYNEILSTIDIAIFAHNRQQGMGNIINLLGLGVKVYMRSSVSTWNLFKDLGIKVFDVNYFDLTPIDPIIAKRNIKLVNLHFSKKTLVKQLGEIIN